MKKVIELKKPVAITSWASVVGKKESEGPLRELFDLYSKDDYFGMNSWEKAETEMQKRAINSMMEKRKLAQGDICLALGGDLCNQITSSAYAFRDFDIPFTGLYGACSTMALSMAMGACLVSGGMTDNALALASSHFCTAERQFRTPLDYGGKRSPTAQWTVTGCGCVFLEREGKGPFIKRVSFGTIEDLGIKDVNNMGAAMAPAAARTIKDFFSQTGQKPSDYDMIFTGDLGDTGSKLLKQILQIEGIELNNHNDCGLIIFDTEKQTVQSGASGCGCSASVLASYILPKLSNKEFKKVLFVATGALMSPTTTMQKESIPSIAHLVEIVAERE
ncbi:MAG: stage V sporulation protein AD [Oscillospiraceae bacterium]